MRLEDLPPAMRRQVMGEVAKPRTSKHEASGPGLPLTCAYCGFVVDPPTGGRLAKHQVEFPNHSRYEWRP